MDSPRKELECFDQMTRQTGSIRKEHAMTMFDQSKQMPGPASNHSQVTNTTTATISVHGVNAFEMFKLEPLRRQWKYNHPVFARYHLSPLFYPGNIAAYLGGGMFIIVFDDGSLDYRVKREDIYLRESCCPESKKTEVIHEDAGIVTTTTEEEDLGILDDDRASHFVLERVNDVKMQLVPVENVELQEEISYAQRLESGIFYLEDETQPSDSDDSSEEDLTMTPWQQMTQTFGISGGGKPLRKRTHHSSLSGSPEKQGSRPRLGSGSNIIPSPKSFRQSLMEFFSRKTKKVQPIAVSADVHVKERIQLMEKKIHELRRPSGTINMSDPTASQLDAAQVFYWEDSVRRYATIKCRRQSGEYELLTDVDDSLSVKVVPPERVEFLPYLEDLTSQQNDLQNASKIFYAGKKVQVNLYQGSKFSGPGVIISAHEPDVYDVLLNSRMRLMNVPIDKMIPMPEKQKDLVSICDDQSLVCSNRARVNIGDQVLVQVNGEFEKEEKLGILNGIYSNGTAAIDFTDGSTGYQISPQAISSFRRRNSATEADIALLSLKNEVLMRQSGKTQAEFEVGYQVKADHPRKNSVESCVIIRKHFSNACDLRFSDGTIAFDIFPSQMIIEQEHLGDSKKPIRPTLNVGDYVLGWSTRFGRYCSAKVVTRDYEGADARYTLVFDYGEVRSEVPADRIALINDSDALSPMQQLTNYSIDTIGYEISVKSFSIGEQVMAKAFGSVKYYHGRIDRVDERDRVCAVIFDSSERDDRVKFSCMFSVDRRHRIAAFAAKTSSSARVRYRDETLRSDSNAARFGRGRRHSRGSLGSAIISVAGTLFGLRKELENRESVVDDEEEAVRKPPIVSLGDRITKRDENVENRMSQ